MYIASSGLIVIERSEILGNTASEHGGGVHCDGNSRMINSVVCGNAAVLNGGGVAWYDSGYDHRLTNCTVMANQAGGYGGGLFGGGLGGFLRNSVVALNDGLDVYGVGEYGNTTIESSFIGLDPIIVRYPSPGGDGIWGTVDDDYGDVAPLPTSPLVNAGDNTLAVDDGGWPLDVDLTGAPRIFDEVDLGACELQDISTPGRDDPSLIVTTAEDVVDLYDGYTSIREAIWFASQEAGEDTVTFESSISGQTVALNGYPLELHSNLSIVGLGANELRIDAGGESRVLFACLSDLTLSGLSISSGHSQQDGGGILAIGNWINRLEINDCVLSEHNAGDNGGALFCKWMLMTTDGMEVVNSQARGDGGAVCYYPPPGEDVPPHFDRLILTGCSARRGGGLWLVVDWRGAEFSDGFFGGNSATSGGGAVYMQGSASSEVVLDGITFAGNTGGLYGGALYSDGADLVLQACKITESRAERYGGGIYAWDCQVITQNSEVSNCYTGGYGGGIYSYGPLSVDNSTIAGNFAGESGGGVHNVFGQFVANNTIIAMNDSPAGPQSTLSPSGYYNYIGGDPSFVVNPGPGDDDTWGTADDVIGDYHLRLGSPCIDAGDNGAVPSDLRDADGDGDVDEPLPFDCEGLPRVADVPSAPDVGKGTPPLVDIGAYEKPLPGDIDMSGVVDLTDLALLSANWGATGNVSMWDGDVDGDSDVDLTDLAILASNWGQGAAAFMPITADILAESSEGVNDAIEVGERWSEQILLAGGEQVRESQSHPDSVIRLDTCVTAGNSGVLSRNAAASGLVHKHLPSAVGVRDLVGEELQAERLRRLKVGSRIR